MLRLKNFLIQDNSLINDLNKSLLNLLKYNFDNFNNETLLPVNGHHFKNLDTNLNNQLKNVIKLYTSNKILNHYYYFFKNYIACEFDNLSDKIGLDFRCWFSISSSVYSLFKNKKIFAVDFYDKELIDNLNKKINTDIEYHHVNDINNVSKVDWIVMYDVLDSYISNISIENDFSNRLEYLRNLLNDNGLLVLTDYESTSKIKLSKLKNIIRKYFIDYKIYYNNDNGRFVITCYRNVSNANLINIRSFSYTGTSFTCRKIASSIDGCSAGVYFNDLKSNDTPKCLKCDIICNLSKSNNFLGKTHLVNNNLYNTSIIKKYYKNVITIYYSRYIYSLIYTYMNQGNTLEKSLSFWINALCCDIPEHNYYLSYESFCENYTEEINKFCKKFNIKYSKGFKSNRCNIYNRGNKSDIYYANYLKNNGTIDNEKYQKIFDNEQKFGSTISDSWKNYFSKKQLDFIYNKIKNSKKVIKKYYDLNVIVKPEKCLDKYFLFKPVECMLEYSNIFNKEINNYSILIKETEKLSNHYLEKKLYNIKNNIDFDFECKVKVKDNNYGIILQSQDKAGKYKNINIDLNTCQIGKDGFKIVKGTFNSSNGSNIFLLRIIFIYNEKQNYLGNNKRQIEIII